MQWYEMLGVLLILILTLWFLWLAQSAARAFWRAYQWERYLRGNRARLSDSYYHQTGRKWADAPEEERGFFAWWYYEERPRGIPYDVNDFTG